MKLVFLLPLFFATGALAAAPSPAMVQEQDDYDRAKANCGKKVECLNKEWAAHKKAVAKIQAEEKKDTGAAAAKRKKAVDEATATAKKKVDDAQAEYKLAVEKAQADYDKAKP